VHRFIPKTALASAAAAVLALTAGAGVAAARSQSSVRALFENTGIDSDAVGAIRAIFRPHKSKLALRVERLAPGEYQLIVGGIIEETFTVEADGRGELRLRTGDGAALDFDPRGRTVAISDGTDVVLSGTFPDPAASGGDDGEGSRTRIRVFLAPTELSAGGSARADFELRDDRRKFKVELENVPSGTYDLFVGDIQRGTITVGALGEAQIEFATNDDDGDELPLTFDPRGQLIEVAQGGAVLFSGTLETTSQGVDVCEERDTRVPLPSTGADPDGDAEVRYRVDDDCDRHFDVEIEDVPLGIYDLVVDGVVAGQITVVDADKGPEGEIEFESGDDDDDDLPLAIDPVGKLIEVVQGDTVFFSGVFDGTTTTPGTCEETDVQIEMEAENVADDGEGEVRFRIDEDCDADLKVQIDDVPAGAYELRVGGVVRGTINVSGDEGEIEFDNDPDEAGELPMSFDAAGQTVEVRRSGALWFHAQLP